MPEKGQRTGEANKSRSDTPSVWEKRALNHPWAASATPTIEPVDAIGSGPLARALAETINGLCKTEVIRQRG